MRKRNAPHKSDGKALWAKETARAKARRWKKFGMSGKQKDRILLTAHDIFLFCCCSHFAGEKKLEK